MYCRLAYSCYEAVDVLKFLSLLPECWKSNLGLQACYLVPSKRITNHAAPPARTSLNSRSCSDCSHLDQTLLMTFSWPCLPYSEGGWDTLGASTRCGSVTVGESSPGWNDTDPPLHTRQARHTQITHPQGGNRDQRREWSQARSRGR